MEKKVFKSIEEEEQDFQNILNQAAQIKSYQMSLERKQFDKLPDFYKEGIVLDAKYKRYADMKLQKVDGNDLHQVITYMYILSAQNGGLIVPGKYHNSEAHPEPKTLNGYGGSINIYSIIVDNLSQNYKDYCRQMCQNEKVFLGLLPKIE